MLFAVLLLAAVTHCATEAVPTYKYKDPVSGKSRNCDMCPAGTRMAAHCTATTATKCVPCQTLHFTQYWNYLSKCLYCNTFCGENQEVEHDCSHVSNRVCRCKQGYFMDSEDYCRRHSKCRPGTTVKTRGTSRTDTVCENCPRGYFSNSSSALQACVKHQECNTPGHMTLLRGSSFHDTVCASCENVRNGTEEVMRVLFPKLFADRMIRLVKIKNFVFRNIHPTATRVVLCRKRRHLLDKINKWSAQAPVEQLRRVPEMLRSSQLYSLAKRLDNRLQEINQLAKHCS